MKFGAGKVVLFATAGNPFGPSSLMPQSEVNPSAHLHERKIKANLNYTVFKTLENHLFNTDKIDSYQLDQPFVPPHWSVKECFYPIEHHLPPEKQQQ